MGLGHFSFNKFHEYSWFTPKYKDPWCHSSTLFSFREAEQFDILILVQGQSSRMNRNVIKVYVVGSDVHSHTVLWISKKQAIQWWLQHTDGYQVCSPNSSATPWGSDARARILRQLVSSPDSYLQSASLDQTTCQLGMNASCPSACFII